MGFDADAYLKALTPPSFTIGGETYTGKLLSFDEMLPFQERFAQVEEGKASLEEIRDVARELCTALELPADKVLSLPMGGVMAAVADFLRCHLAAETPAVSQEQS